MKNMHAHGLLQQRCSNPRSHGFTAQPSRSDFRHSHSLRTPKSHTKRRQTHRLRCMGDQQQNAAVQSSSQSSPANSVLSIFCPLLKLVSGGDAAAPRARWAEVATSGFASMARLPFGTTVGPAAALRAEDPAKPLQLFAFEACPFCRRVAEAITDLDLDVDYYPTPKDSVRHRQLVQEAGGQQQFPFLIDPNTKPRTVMYESEAIVRYLYEKYGGGSEPPQGLLFSTLISGWVPTLLRAGRGMVRYAGAAAEAPPQLLRLYDYDGNQFSRLVREALCELELPYERVSCSKGSKRRAQLKDLSGSTRVPYLVDDNTGIKMSESEEIVKYLFDTYSTRPASAG